MTNCGDVSKHLFGWSSCYVTYTVSAAAQRLYNNNQGILDQFGEFWRLIASKLRDYPNVLGYELLNEPWLGDVPLEFKDFTANNPNWDLWFPKVSDRRNDVPTYRKLHDYIRSVDNNTIIFFEPATGGNFLDAWPVGFEEGPGGVEYNDRQALSYHVYCLYVDEKQATNFLQYLLANLSVTVCDVMDDTMYNVRRDDVYAFKLAGFLTEFGNAGEGQAAEDVIDFATAKMDEFMHVGPTGISHQIQKSQTPLSFELLHVLIHKRSLVYLCITTSIRKKKSLKWSTHPVWINLVLSILRKYSHQRSMHTLVGCITQLTHSVWSETMSMIPCRCCTFKRRRLIQIVRLN